MIIKKISYVAVALLVMTGCAQNSPESPVRNDVKCSPYSRSLEEGLKAADVLFSKMSGDATRSVSRQVKSVEVINRSTRSDSPESAFYIVNYEDNSGFALLSADKRLEPVFGISEEGQLSLSDTISNKPLAWYIRKIEKVADEVVSSVNAPVTEGMDTVITPKEPDLVVVISWPLIDSRWNKSILAKFHQRSPYNKYCFTADGKQALVGCGPLAAGTVMGFYEWPESYKGYTFDWAAMKADGNHDGWARLFGWIGGPGNMNAMYGEDATGTYEHMFIPMFRNFGYKDMHNVDFTIEGANSELKNGKPLVVSGYDDGKSAGHAWIIDGAQYIEKSLTVETPRSRTYYYHCVWGWGGKNNGSFIFSSGISVNSYIFGDMGYVANLNKNM